jgi:hypothetical protein
MKTQSEIEAMALRDFRQHFHSILLVDSLSGYVGDSCDSADFQFDPWIAVRVVGPSKPENGIYHWNDTHLDPYWDVEIVDLKHPDLPKAGLRSPWMFGISYSTATGEEDGRRGFRTETIKEKFSRIFRGSVRQKAAQTLFPRS